MHSPSMDVSPKIDQIATRLTRTSWIYPEESPDIGSGMNMYDPRSILEEGRRRISPCPVMLRDPKAMMKEVAR
jgi:hypothetical protein